MAPTASPLCPSFNTNKMSAMFVSWLPVFEISWPMKNSRKLRVASDWKVLPSTTTLDAPLPCASEVSEHNQAFKGLKERLSAFIIDPPPRAHAGGHRRRGDQAPRERVRR